MPGTIRAIAVVAGLLPYVATGCGSDRAPDGKQDVEAVASPMPEVAAPAWSGVPLGPPTPWTGLEMLRDPSSEKLNEALADPGRRGRAAWALGRIGGPRARDRLAAALQDDVGSNSELVGAVSFLEPPASAPGDVPEPAGGWVTLEDALWTRYAVTEIADEASAILLAVARVGGSRSMQRLAADTEVLPSAAHEPRHRSALEAMGILCARGHGLSRAGLESVAMGLAADSADLQAAAAYTLGRCAAPSAEQVAGEERARLVELVVPLTTAATDPELASLAWKALAGLGEVPEDVDPAILGPEPPPWLVEVEAVRALAAHADGRAELTKRLARLPGAGLAGTRTQVVLAALAGLRDAVAGSPEMVERLRAFAGTVAGARAGARGRDVKRFALVGCELGVLLAIVDGGVDRVDSCAEGVAGLPPWYGASLEVEAVLRGGAALSRAEKLSALLSLARDARAPVAAQALSGLADVDDPRVSEVLRGALRSDDVGVSAAAAASIAARAVDASRRDSGAAEALRQAVARLDNTTAVEARVATVEALGSLARSATRSQEVEATAGWLEATVVPLASDSNAAVRRVAREALLGRDDDLLARFDATPPPASMVDAAVTTAWQRRDESVTGLRLVTDTGVIAIDFGGAPAPLMQAVIADLARKGFYDGLTIHRVVPGFVVQGGDPHGDGYGGPGFIVPCERSTLRYERGTVGIALAGKDTGGSQFFIAQTRQPHLDARYTVIGRVVEGMEVVDGLLPHDQIVRVELVAGR